MISSYKPVWYPKSNEGPAPLATNASATFPVINVQRAKSLRIQVTGATTSTPVGTFKLQGSESPLVESDLNSAGSAALWTDMTLPSGSVHGTGFTFSGPSVSVSWDGSATLNLMIDILDPPSFMRLVWTRTGGGSATASLIGSFGWREE